MGESLNQRQEIIKQLKWRYAVKKFDPAKNIADKDWEILEQSLILAPSSFGLQPYKFFVITDPAKKAELQPAAYGQSQVVDCSHLVVVAYKKTLSEKNVEDFIDLIAETRGMPREKLADFEAATKGAAQRATEGGYMEAWNSRQAYIALGFLLETAAILGIDACPMEGFVPAKVNEILGLEDHTAVALCTLGYRDAEKDWLEPLAKVRFSKKDLIERI